MAAWIYRDYWTSIAFLVFFALVSVGIFFLRKRFKKKSIPFWGVVHAESKGLLFFVKGVYFLIFGSALILFFIAFARPYTKKLISGSTQKGIDILFALDISDSMLIEDMQPQENRLESAKFHIKKFIEQRPFDRMGLVVFSGEAYTRVPLTLDHGLLLQNLEGLEVSDFIKKGTAIGVALASSVNRIRESETQSKVIVLLTDGENNTGVIDPLTALELTVDEGARVYTIGIGRDGIAQLPIFRRDRSGRKIKTYRPFPTKINEELLRRIAFETGGSFYRASVGGDLFNVFDSINKIETYEIENPDTFSFIEHFQGPLFWSFLLFIIGYFYEFLFFWRGL